MERVFPCWPLSRRQVTEIARWRFIFDPIEITLLRPSTLSTCIPTYFFNHPVYGFYIKLKLGLQTNDIYSTLFWCLCKYYLRSFKVILNFSKYFHVIFNTPPKRKQSFCFKKKNILFIVCICGKCKHVLVLWENIKMICELFGFTSIRSAQRYPWYSLLMSKAGIVITIIIHTY